ALGRSLRPPCHFAAPRRPPHPGGPPLAPPRPLLGPVLLNHPAPTRISTLSLHDALPISPARPISRQPSPATEPAVGWRSMVTGRSEEHTSELQSLTNLVCRLLLEKKTTRPGASGNRPAPDLGV